MSKLAEDYTEQDIQFMTENNLHFSVDEFRNHFTPPLSRAFVTKCLHEGTLRHFRVGSGPNARFKIPATELKTEGGFRERLLLGNPKTVNG